jgi:hypothetical protein
MQHRANAAATRLVAVHPATNGCFLHKNRLARSVFSVCTPLTYPLIPFWGPCLESLSSPCLPSKCQKGVLQDISWRKRLDKEATDKKDVWSRSVNFRVV